MYPTAMYETYNLRFYTCDWHYFNPTPLCFWCRSLFRRLGKIQGCYDSPPFVTRSSGDFRRFGAPVIRRQPSFLHDLETSGRFPRQHFFPSPFFGYGFGGGYGVYGEQPAIIIQQFQPPVFAQASEATENRVYVQPRWVDGGYGVQVLQPGYWADPRQLAGR